MKTKINYLIKFLALTASVLIFTTGLLAQTPLQKAKDLKMKGEFTEAIKLYKDYIKISSRGY